MATDEFRDTPPTTTRKSAIPLFFARMALNAGTGDQFLPIKHLTAAIAEFRFDTDHAVEPAFLEQARKTLLALPERRFNLRIGIKAESSAVENNLFDEKVEKFIGEDEKENTVSRNPFKLIRPQGIKNINGYIDEQRKGWYIHSWSRIDQRAKGGASMALESEQIDDNFIRLNHAYNEYYFGFLESMNIVDPTERAKRVQQIGEKIFNDKPFGFSLAQLEEFKKIAPFDNPTQWMVFAALNILTSAEPGITGMAKYRAVELLSHFNQEEVELAFFGNKGSTKSGPGRNAPAWDWQDAFQKTLLRLPRSFWIQSDRKESIHKNWMKNPTILKILGFPEGLPSQAKLDYGEIANRLVEQYPREAIQVELLLLAGQTWEKDHDRQALQTLIKFAQLDKATILKVFGPLASYHRIHIMPGSDEDRISEALGIAVFDEDLAADFAELGNEELLQVIRRLQKSKAYLMEQVGRQSAMAAEAFFSVADEKKISQLDPKGYWRLLGVHPNTTEEDRAEVLKAAYARLARKYHPDMTEKPNEEKMKAINEAYGILSDNEQRKAYCGF